jgi:DNA polymerase-4
MTKDENTRKIIHIDMDAFYASVEQRDFPEYKGKPVAVGGTGVRGVVATASYEARKYGIHSAMSTLSAKKKCTDLIVVPPRFSVYKRISREIMDIFYEYTDKVEPLSLDEAFLDVTRNRKNIPSATFIAREIKSKILTQTTLTASAGVSFNKFLAKIASDMHKPDGLVVIKPEEAERFIESLKIEKFFGIGKATSERMHKMGIFTGKDLKKRSVEELVRIFGKNGEFFYKIARAQDDREVNTENIRKSYSREQTFDTDIDDLHMLKEKIEKIAVPLWKGINRTGFKGKTVTLKIKYTDFIQVTRSKTITHFADDYQLLLTIVFELLEKEFPLRNKIRLLGIGLSNANEETKNQPQQLTLGF